MTTTHRERTLYENIAQSNVEELTAQNRQLRTRITMLMDANNSLVSLPTLEIVRFIEHAQYHGCLAVDSAVWLRDVKEKMG